MCIKISGLKLCILLDNCSKFLISPNSHSIPSPTFAFSNNEGFVFTSKEYPLTIQPILCNHNDNQEPLNPLCPVKKTFFPLQKL